MKQQNESCVGAVLKHTNVSNRQRLGERGRRELVAVSGGQELAAG